MGVASAIVCASVCTREGVPVSVRLARGAVNTGSTPGASVVVPGTKPTVADWVAPKELVPAPEKICTVGPASVPPVCSVSPVACNTAPAWPASWPPD